MDKEKELLKVLFTLTAAWSRELDAGLSAGKSLLAYQQGRADALRAVIDCAGFSAEYQEWSERQCKKV